MARVCHLFFMIQQTVEIQDHEASCNKTGAHSIMNNTSNLINRQKIAKCPSLLLWASEAYPHNLKFLIFQCVNHSFSILKRIRKKIIHSRYISYLSFYFWEPNHAMQTKWVANLITQIFLSVMKYTFIIYQPDKLSFDVVI